MNKTEFQQQVAATIAQQLGGVGRLNIMTGAHTFQSCDSNDWTYADGVKPPAGAALKFSIKARAKQGIKVVMVVLDEAMDLYNMYFLRLNGLTHKRPGFVIKAQHEGIYDDMLQDIFEQETGLYLTL